MMVDELGKVEKMVLLEKGRSIEDWEMIEQARQMLIRHEDWQNADLALLFPVGISDEEMTAMIVARRTLYRQHRAEEADKKGKEKESC